MDAEIAKEISRLTQQLDALRKRVDDASQSERLPDQPIITLLHCIIGEIHAALLVDQIDEVLPIVALTPVPETASWVAGILNLRGEAIPVLDVNARINRTKSALCTKDFIIVNRVDTRSFGLIVQEVKEIEDVERKLISPPPRGLAIAPYLLGTISSDHQHVSVLSTKSLVETSDLPDPS